jgi:hypothetical protein
MAISVKEAQASIFGLLFDININANFSGKWVKTGVVKGNT